MAFEGAVQSFLEAFGSGFGGMVQSFVCLWPLECFVDRACDGAGVFDSFGSGCTPVAVSLCG
jgi:hypothetical protein